MSAELRAALTKLADEWGPYQPATAHLRALLDAHPEPTEAADLRLSENGWLYEQKDACDCASYYGAHEYTCATEPWVNLTELPGWAEMLAANATPDASS